jgi:hypothetical protein
LDDPVSPKEAAAPGRQLEQETPKEGSSVDQLGSSQRRIVLRNESLTNGEVKLDAEKSPEGAIAEQDEVPGVEANTKTEVGTSSRQLLN